MLTRMWRKGNVTVHCWYFSKETKNTNLKRQYTPIAVLFMISIIWKQPKCPSVDEWMKMMWRIHARAHTYTGTLFNHKREQNLAICNNMDMTSRILCYLKCQTKKNTIGFHLYVESKKENRWTNKAETDSQRWRINQWLPEGLEDRKI